MSLESMRRRIQMARFFEAKGYFDCDIKGVIPPHIQPLSIDFDDKKVWDTFIFSNEWADRLRDVAKRLGVTEEQLIGDSLDLWETQADAQEDV